jgi:signal transduction histidine kinase
MKPSLAPREKRSFLLFLLFVLLIAGIAFAYIPFPTLAIVFVLLIASATVFYFSLSRAEVIHNTNGTAQSGLASITGILEDALIAYNDSFTVLFVNFAAEKLFLLEAKEIVGTQIRPQDAENPRRRLLAQVIFPSLAPKMIPRTAAGVSPQVVDVTTEDPALELRVTTARTHEGDGFLKIIRNRTREVALIKSKNEFVAVASHQLRTPTNEILWALQAVNNDVALTSETKTLAEGALHSAEQLATLIDDILNAARIEEGRFGYAFTSADIIDFLAKISGEILPQAEREGIKLYFDRPKEALPRVMIDDKKLAMVVTNLLENAIKYNVDGGEVILAVKKQSEGPFVEVSIKDTGIGIPAEGVEKLFSKFFRAQNAVKSVPDGTGLGLFIAQNIVRAHGGQMRAESELNRGSTFSFTLPTDPSLVPTGEMALE